jgi:hypothetical protein
MTNNWHCNARQHRGNVFPPNAVKRVQMKLKNEQHVQYDKPFCDFGMFTNSK